MGWICLVSDLGAVELVYMFEQIKHDTYAGYLTYTSFMRERNE